MSGTSTDRWKSTLEALDEGSRWILLEIPKALGFLAALSPLALAVGLAALGLWWFEHGAHVRQNAQLEEVQKQTEAHVSDLQNSAAQAIRSAGQGSQRIAQLETDRHKLERDAADLRQRLAALQGEEQVKVAQVAALSGPDVAKEVATRLGLGPDDLGISGARPDARTPPQAARLAGGAAASTASTLPAQSQPGSDSSLPPGGTLPPEFPPASSFELTPAALRRVDAALVQLDGCERQATVRDQQISVCQQQSAAQSGIIDQQKSSIGDLNKALADKDKIIDARQAGYTQELKIARGTWSSRLVRTVEYVAIGMAIGAALVH